MGVSTLSPRARKRVETHKERRDAKRLIADLIDEDLADQEADAEELAAFFGPDEDDDWFADTFWDATRKGTIEQEKLDAVHEEERTDVLERGIDPGTGGSIRSVEQLKELRRYLEGSSGPLDAEERLQYTAMLTVVEAVEADRKELAGII